MYSAGLLGHWHSIYVRSAAKPWGPFDAPRLAFRQHVATGNGLFNVKEVFYCPCEWERGPEVVVVCSLMLLLLLSAVVSTQTSTQS